MSILDGKINKATPIPLYFQLKELILQEIKSGNYPVDSLIPTEKEISDAFGISRTTVRQATTELVQEGWLHRIKSKGTFVSHPKINQDFIQKLESFNDQILRSNMTPSTQLLDFGVRKAPPTVADALQLDASAQAIYLFRKRFADDTPIVTIETYLPFQECQSLLEHDFSKESLYAVLALQKNTKIYYVKRLVEAVEATSKDEQHLLIKKGKPIQYFTSVGFNIYDKPIEYSLARYRGDRNSFAVTVYPSI